MRDDPMFWVAAIACLVVAGILLWGIGSFGAGADPKKANKIMQYRIIAQLVAVLLVVGFVWLRSRGAN